jgi:Flp pilus assembly protein TadD
MRFSSPHLMAALLCGVALTGCASNNLSELVGGKTAAEAAKSQIDSITKTPPTDLESGVRQASLLRQAGHYDEAVHILSQLMLVASDDPRVVGEYGKTLTQMGRAQDAAQFLHRAVELQGNDWTLYSAMGVAYDQLGDQESARAAYEHALALKPAEPSVLNNYALSRMLAHDPSGARALVERARIAGGDADPKIARNMELVKNLAPEPPAPVAGNLAYAVEKPAPAPTKLANSPAVPAGGYTAAPKGNVASAPRALKPVPSANLPPAAPTVVMQKVPVDPLAGPVAAHRAPHKLAKVKPVPALKKTLPEAEAGKPSETAKAKQADTKPVVKVKTAEAPKPNSAVPSLRMASGSY